MAKGSRRWRGEVDSPDTRETREEWPAWAPVVPRPSRRRATVAIALLVITTGLMAIEALVTAQGFGLVASVATTEGDIERWVALLANLGNLGTGAYLLSGAAFLAWLSRVVENLPALGGGTPMVSPRAAIGWWFAPLANLFQPFRIVADAWRRLALAPHERGISVLVLWWVLWIGGAIASFLIGAMAVPQTLDEVNVYLAALIGVQVAQIVAGFLVVRVIAEMERRSAARFAARTSPSAPVRPLDEVSPEAV